jgi:hypothetical protein
LSARRALRFVTIAELAKQFATNIDKARYHRALLCICAQAEALDVAMFAIPNEVLIAVFGGGVARQCRVNES